MPQLWTQPYKETDKEPSQTSQIDHLTPKDRRNPFQSGEDPPLNPGNNTPTSTQLPKPTIETPAPNSHVLQETPVRDPIPKVRIRRDDDDSWSIAPSKPNLAVNAPYMVTPLRPHCTWPAQYSLCSSPHQCFAYQMTPVHGISPAPYTHSLDPTPTQTPLCLHQSLQCPGLSSLTTRLPGISPQSTQCPVPSSKPTQYPGLIPQTVQCPFSQTTQYTPQITTEEPKISRPLQMLT